MLATVAPEGLTDALVWSVVDGTGSATISAVGLLTSTRVGTVTVHAVAGTVLNDYPLTINPTILTTLIDFETVAAGSVGLVFNPLCSKSA